jgi:group I intron endonuclease
MGYIYKIVNKVTNKIYIGQTTSDLEERWKGHCKSSSHCVYLKNAMNKYGKENFELKLICICFDSDLNNYEKEYIKKYDCVVPNGYNLKYGGENGGKHSDIVKQKISESMKKITSKKINSKEFQDHLKLMCEKRRKKVFQYDLNNNLINVFNSCKEAAKYLEVGIASISNTCNGRYKTCKGFILKNK